MIYYYTRKREYDEGQYNLNRPPIDGVCGGGMNTKAYNFLKAVDGQLIDDLSETVDHGIALIDPLAISQITPLSKGESPDRIADFERSLMTKILWCEEQEIIRCNYNQRLSLCDKADGVYACNLYLQSILKEYGIDAGVLYSPVDHTLFKPAKQKKPKIVVSGQVSYAKGTDKIIEMFGLLPDEIEKVFVGNAKLWGMESRKTDADLEKELGDVCTHIQGLTHTEMAAQFAEAWGYVTMSKYDVGSFSFLEAGMSGCEVFAHDLHRQFDEYENVIRTADSPKVMATVIESRFATFDPDIHNTELRKELIKKHSYQAFRKSLKAIVGNLLVPDVTHIKGELDAPQI